MVADVRVGVTLGAEKLVVGLKTRQLMLMLMVMLRLGVGRPTGMDVRTAARAVETDQ